jgi:glycosyltransferase involved in cell wall biosynthesis
MPGIDVLIPCYQYGRFLRAAALSVLTQDVPGLRVLIIDNASTDDSVAVARQLAAEDPRVEVRARTTNLGMTASFNEGIDWARADCFMMFCADDLLAPGALARAVAFMDRHPRVAFTHGQEIEFRDQAAPPDIGTRDKVVEWRVTPGRAFIEARCRRPASYIALGTMVARTAAQKRAGHYRAELTVAQDVEMMLRLAMLGDVAETTAVQGFRRLHGTNLSDIHVRSRRLDLAFRQAAFESFFASAGHGLADAQRLRRRVTLNFATRASRWSLRALSRGQAGPALDLIGYALRTGALAARP